jgi:H/ACA ribonucleoprotein complex subunit 2
VVKALRKGEKGVLVIAGNITPIDVISHIAVLAEEMDIPYVYVDSKEALGEAGGSKRPTSAILVKKEDDYAELFTEVSDKLKTMSPTF